jgi:outer membrane protein OmpA-like peptidoglycan-associated protein
MLKQLLAVVAAAFLLGACETPTPTPPPPASPPVRNFLVFFDFDKASLTPRAMDIVKEAANVAKAGQDARVTCTGHTDTSGPANYNMALSLRRANTVKDALVREGVSPTAISVVGRGEEALLVATGDGVREPQNRRVEIVIQ